ncbi:MAG TPA: hypothetical protein ENF52_06390 [Chloroflexi bacterium]|nr:hypothetical protein [Chloroflexota bacterium]
MSTIAYIVLWLALAVAALDRRYAARWSRRVAAGMIGCAWGMWAILLVRRALDAGHWPLSTRYEFALCWVWSTLAIYFLLEADRQRAIGWATVVAALLIATYALTRPASERAMTPLPPILRSVWLQLHVLTTVMGYAVLGVAAAAALAALSVGRQSSPEEHQATEIVERTMERMVALGLPWLTAAILTGAIWAEHAWGRYWGWDPKETWSLVTWLWYLLILHIAPLPRWRGRPLAWLVLAGYGLILFTFMGVPWLVRTVRLESLHGF